MICRAANRIPHRLQYVRHGRKRESRQKRVSRGKKHENKIRFNKYMSPNSGGAHFKDT